MRTIELPRTTQLPWLKVCDYVSDYVRSKSIKTMRTREQLRTTQLPWLRVMIVSNSWRQLWLLHKRSAIWCLSSLLTSVFQYLKKGCCSLRILTYYSSLSFVHQCLYSILRLRGISLLLTILSRLLSTLRHSSHSTSLWYRLCRQQEILSPKIPRFSMSYGSL